MPNAMQDATLPTLRAGQMGVVDRINAGQSLAKRLADLGFVRGATLEMIRPGIPCIVAIGGARVGLGWAHQISILLGAV